MYSPLHCRKFVGEKMEPYNKSLLIVDDEEMVLLVLTEFFQQFGCRVTTVRDSEKALNLFRRNPGEFDTGILDYRMPGLTGLDLAEKMLKIRCDIPIVIFAGFVDWHLKYKAYSMGIKLLFEKPVIGSQLLEMISSIPNNSNIMKSEVGLVA